MLAAAAKIRVLSSRLRKNEFVKNTKTLAIGILVAQLMTLLVSPILTRVYSANSFAIYALFTSIFSIILPAGCARYDIAMVVIHDREDLDGLLVLSTWIAGLVSSLMFFLVFFWEVPLKNLSNAFSLGQSWIALPFVLFLYTIINLLRFFANSHKNYKIISYSFILQVSIISVVSILLGLIGFKTYGLLVGLSLGLIGGILFLVFKYREKFSHINWWFNKSSLNLLVKYKNFPIYSALPSVLDSVTTLLPIFFLSRNFPEYAVAYYFLLMRVASAPLEFLAKSISQIHLKRISQDFIEKINSSGYLVRLSFLLILIVSVPMIIFIFFAPEIFVFVFGLQWKVAGELLVILIPSLILRFVVSTLSGSLVASGHNKLGALWQYVAFVVTFCIFLIYASKLELKHFFMLMMITDLFLYSFYYFLIWYAIKNPRNISG